MLSERNVRLLKIIGVVLLVAGILYHEAGLKFDERTIFRVMDAVSFRIAEGFKALTRGEAHGEAGVAAQATAIADYEIADKANAINVLSFGAKGDGRTDDTKAIQEAVNAVPASGGTVLIPAGVYLIDATQSVHLRSNVTLHMARGAVLQAIPNRADRYAVLTVENVSNVQIVGGVIQGDRKRHYGSSGQWGTGIEISGAKNVTVRGTACNDCWGDGFYIGNEAFVSGDPSKLFGVPENIRLIDVRANNNRRQGISLICGRNVEFVRPLLTNTRGIDPEGGLDIEPNAPRDLIDNVVVTDPVTRGNAGAGILINLSELAGASVPASIKIVNHRDEGSDRGMLIVAQPEREIVVAGTVLVENPQWLNSQKNGLAITDHDQRSFSIIIRNPAITNANRRAFRFEPEFGAAIAVYHQSSNGASRTGGIGNVAIYNPMITDISNTPKILTPFYVWEEPGRTIANLIIVDPVVSGNVGAIGSAAKPFVMYTNGQQ